MIEAEPLSDVRDGLGANPAYLLEVCRAEKRAVASGALLKSPAKGHDRLGPREPHAGQPLQTGRRGKIRIERPRREVGRPLRRLQNASKEVQSEDFAQKKGHGEG